MSQSWAGAGGKQPYTSAFALPIGGCSVLLCIAIELLYRPYIYREHLQDFGIADSGVSFFSTIAAYFVLSLYEKTSRHLLAALYVTIGACLYELLQLLTGLGVFSVSDLIACMLGGFAVAAYICIERRYRRCITP
ncbi:hypothetical protein [Alteromonas gilva]|uniref:VanZ-like domain-containing protein n=1 Tax=Alteromonas gilva TaxID=2987522 RepID=A0ABT5L318_9ALTE|nr:hypothetical protein [Alteromonas gilva]MDC8830242.1 hypothetical protein [Alteromonas gilva]